MHTPTPPQHDAASQATAAFQGDIAAIALENIFQLFDFAALTGKLEVRAPDNHGNFYFSQGTFTYGMLHVHPRKIGEILSASGVISEEQLRECLRLHEQDGQQRPLGQVLLDKGYIDPSLLDDSLLRQVKEAFFTALAWRQGTFAFYPGLIPTSETMQLRERVDHLMLEGMVYLDTLASPDS